MDIYRTKTTIWGLAQSLRASAPLVQNITNLVVQTDSADAIAAVGGTQVTLHTIEEADAAARVCSALALNLGTLDEAFLRCARTAVPIIQHRKLGWVLDPVAAGMTSYRREAAREFLETGPTALKANASEVLAVAGDNRRGRGADSVDPVEDAMDAARELAARHHCVVIVTGARDFLTDGERDVFVENGDPLMGRMIGAGCMLTAVVGCFLAVSEDPFDAAIAATAYYGVAGEIAAERATGPGTLKPLLIDALYNLTREELESRLRLEAKPQS